MLPLLLQPPSRACRRSSSCPNPGVRGAARRAGVGASFLQSAFGVAEQRQQLVAHDLDDLLDRRQALQDGLLGRLVANAIDERLDDLEVDVGFEQRQPDFAQRRLDVLSVSAGLRPAGVKAPWIRVLSDSNMGTCAALTHRRARYVSPTDANPYLMAG